MHKNNLIVGKEVVYFMKREKAFKLHIREGWGYFNLLNHLMQLMNFNLSLCMFFVSEFE